MSPDVAEWRLLASGLSQASLTSTQRTVAPTLPGRPVRLRSSKASMQRLSANFVRHW